MQSVDTTISSEGNLASPRQASSKLTSKKMPSLSFHRKHSGKPVHQKAAERHAGGRQDEGVDLGVDHFPGGDAMLEVLTRLQNLQDSFYVQLQVSLASCSVFGWHH